jgi:Zn-dependent protease with chaperone function
MRLHVHDSQPAAPDPGGAGLPGDAAQARRYHRILRRIGVADMALGLAVMGVILLTGWTGDFRNFAVRLAGDRYAVALFLYTTILLLLTKFLSLGLDYYSFLIEHRYHLSHQRLRSWAWDETKGFALAFVFGQLLVQVIYLLIRWQPQWWWVTAWVLFLLFSVLLAQIAPVLLFPLFFRFHVLNDEELTARLKQMCERAGARIRGVYEWKLSEKTRKANAALMGLGRTRRIVISDTLLGTCSHDEIEAVLAHELGHHVHRHMPKGIVVQSVVTFFGFWCLKMAIRWAALDWRRFEQIDFANLPLMILVATAISVLLMPVMNAYSRFNERQADAYAWQTLGSVEAFCSAMEKLAGQNLAEREPARWVEILFHSHPATGRRVKAALAWAAARKSS